MTDRATCYELRDDETGVVLAHNTNLYELIELRDTMPQTTIHLATPAETNEWKELLRDAWAGFTCDTAIEIYQVIGIVCGYFAAWMAIGGLVGWAFGNAGNGVEAGFLTSLLVLVALCIFCVAVNAGEERR